MQIKDLQPKQGKVDITVDVVEKAAPREFQKFGNPGKLCNIKIKDETGQTTMTLWNDQVEKVKIGDKIKITNGYVNEWQGELQLSTGKFGQLEIVGKANLTEESVKSSKPIGVDEEEEIDDTTEKESEEVDDEESDNHDNINEEEIN
ncbi:hypothetical protein HZA96_04670 [Candidatus Woesearchaeota archaeon]|nr:hypothetical protein [Candidatus Woesearchaeota archaeon]